MERKQTELPIPPQALKTPEMVDMALIERVPNKLEALRLCTHLSGLTDSEIASRMGYDKGHFSRMLSAQSKSHFPPEDEIRFCYVCGNYAPIQFTANKAGFELVARTRTRMEVMEDRIKELEARVADG